MRQSIEGCLTQKLNSACCTLHRIFSLQRQLNKLYAQSWTALFRAFSSHRQPSAIFSKVFPAAQTSWPNWQPYWFAQRQMVSRE